MSHLPFGRDRRDWEQGMIRISFEHLRGEDQTLNDERGNDAKYEREKPLESG